MMKEEGKDNEKVVVASSQAKRRLEAMATSVDHRLAAAFTVILLIYAMITFSTLISIENQSFTTPVLHSVKVVSNPNSAAQLLVQGHPHPQQQQQQQDDAADAAAAIYNPPVRSSIKADEIPDIETLQHTFPVHAGNDMEMIDHPGAFLADQQQFKKVLQQHPELPFDGKIKVPKFWRPIAYGPEGVRHFLGQGGQRLITPEEASQIGSRLTTTEGLETVYISVASYRDPECQPTVEDVFLRAQHPERLRVAIIDQRADDDSVAPCGRPTKPCEEEPQQALCMYSHLIDVLTIPAQFSVGPVFARHLAHRMYRGEYFAMQIDSHVRFTEHWDTDLIQQWKSAKNEMAVMSTYLSDIIGSIDPVTHHNKHPNRPIMCKTGYEGNGKMRHLRHGQQPEGMPGIHGEPTLHPFWAAGFSFARGHFVVQIPYDQFQPMVFQGEEIFIGLRGFTFGYDYYTAERSVAFHMYALKENKEKRKKVKLFWENTNLYPGSGLAGMKRLNGIIGMGDPEDEYYHGHEEEYGLGQVRSKEKFFKMYGIHTDTKTNEDHLCTFVGKPMMNLFKPLLRDNGMGLDFDKIDYEFKDPEAKKKKAEDDKPKAALQQ